MTIKYKQLKLAFASLLIALPVFFGVPQATHTQTVGATGACSRATPSNCLAAECVKNGGVVSNQGGAHCNPDPTACNGQYLSNCTDTTTCSAAGGAWSYEGTANCRTKADAAAGGGCSLTFPDQCKTVSDCTSIGHGVWDNTNKVCTAAANPCIKNGGKPAVGISDVACTANSDPALNGTQNCTAAGCTTIVTKYINPTINLLAAFVGIAVTLSIIIGGIQYGSSAGDPQKAAQAKNRIRNSLIALISFIFLYSLLNFLIPGGAF